MRGILSVGAEESLRLRVSSRRLRRGSRIVVGVDVAPPCGRFVIIGIAQAAGQIEVRRHMPGAARIGRDLVGARVVVALLARIVHALQLRGRRTRAIVEQSGEVAGRGETVIVEVFVQVEQTGRAFYGLSDRHGDLGLAGHRPLRRHMAVGIGVDHRRDYAAVAIVRMEVPAAIGGRPVQAIAVDDVIDDDRSAFAFDRGLLVAEDVGGEALQLALARRSPAEPRGGFIEARIRDRAVEQLAAAGLIDMRVIEDAAHAEIGRRLPEELRAHAFVVPIVIFLARLHGVVDISFAVRGEARQAVGELIAVADRAGGQWRRRIQADLRPRRRLSAQWNIVPHRPADAHGHGRRPAPQCDRAPRSARLDQPAERRPRLDGGPRRQRQGIAGRL